MLYRERVVHLTYYKQYYPLLIYLKLNINPRGFSTEKCINGGSLCDITNLLLNRYSKYSTVGPNKSK